MTPLFPSVAYIMVRLSSTYEFGVEGDSPKPIRDYGAALLEKSYKLAPAIFGENEAEQKENRDAWINRIFGTNDLGVSCTAILTDTMHTHAEKNFNATWQEVKPLAWV
jgi:hypothetical protein